MKPDKVEKTTSTKNVLVQIKGAFRLISDKAYERRMRNQNRSKLDPSSISIPMFSAFA